MRLAGADLLEGADGVVPVPLHRWRAFQRGFNQADDLSVYLGLPVWRVLRRTRFGPPQSALTAHGRAANVAGAFATRRTLLALVMPLRAPSLRNRAVVLVDDVMTTGATLNACSEALLEAGVRSVRALTAARAVAERPGRRPA
jgi:ComF family protein